jgi:nicotinate-nucleotide adenylyltransferase
VTTARSLATRAGPQIGLFGGSFDPVHDAHLALARSAIESLSLDTLLWIPTGQAWQKARTLTPALDRIAMLRLAIDGDERQRIDTCEVDREGPSYMVDTVLELQGRHPQARLWLLLGQDQLANLPTWHRWRELVSLVGFAVANRAGVAVVVPAELGAAGALVADVPLTPMAISSTEIRQRVAAGQGVTSLVPTPVARYIDEHGLYSNPHRS